MAVAVQSQPGMPKNWHEITVNYDLLTEKYNKEREKRVRQEGDQQYNSVTTSKISSTLDPMTDDPFVKPGFNRDPVVETHDIVIVGGGVGGVQVAARLVAAGHKDVMVIEKGGDFGGVCPGEEIQRYLSLIAKKYDLYSKSLLQTEAQDMRWNEVSKTWDISTTRGDKITAKWLIPATGPFDTPKFPGIPGIETFKGKQFHTSRWDYDYTGGDSRGNLTKLVDKRVGIIGTGATAVQIMPHLGAWSGELFVFQRTPSSIDIRGNKPTDEEWFKSQPSGWQRTRMDNFAAIVTGDPTEGDLVNDGWTKTVTQLGGWFGTGGDGTAESEEKRLQTNDYRKMESIRMRIGQVVKDPKTAEALKPYFNAFCKRPCFHDDYLPTFNRKNVTLVDTSGKGVDCITERGIVANGKEYELDVIIYSTGFEFSTDWKQRHHHANVFGNDGKNISDEWHEGPVTYHGWSVRGFPNAFFISPSQTSGLPNYGHSLEDQTSHLLYLMDKCKRDGIDRLECSAEAQEKWVAEVIEKGKGRHKFLNFCTPGYYNDEGKVGDFTSKHSPYGGSPTGFLEMVRRWRKADTLEGLEVHHQE